MTSQYFNEWTTLAAPFSSTLIFNTARPQEDFKELLEDEAFQRPCGLSPSLSVSFSLCLARELSHADSSTHSLPPSIPPSLFLERSFSFISFFCCLFLSVSVSRSCHPAYLFLSPSLRPITPPPLLVCMHTHQLQ